MADELNVVKEALVHYRSMWAWWLELKMTTEAERELARMKIALIDRELLSMAEAEGQSPEPSGLTLRPSGPPKPAFESTPMDHTSDLIRCGNEGCGEPIERVQGQYKYPWRHVETEDRFCDVSPKNPAYGKSATPPTP